MVKYKFFPIISSNKSYVQAACPFLLMVYHDPNYTQMHLAKIQFGDKFGCDLDGRLKM